jgi:hypothetical protein
MPLYLLDKNISRRAIEALYHLDNLSVGEVLVLRLWRQLQTEQSRLFVPVGTVNILRQFAHLREVRTFLASVIPLESGRYLKRWARRLREHGFTREDALILALCTYGTTTTTDILGVDGLITLDQPLINNFRMQEVIVQKRLSAMTHQLSEPYYRATLPNVIHPEEIFLPL